MFDLQLYSFGDSVMRFDDPAFTRKVIESTKGAAQ